MTELPPTEVEVPLTAEEAEQAWSDAKSERIAEYRQSVIGSIQQILTEMSALQDKVLSAKTDVKQQYYKKKIHKMRPQLMELIALNARLETLNEANVN